MPHILTVTGYLENDIYYKICLKLVLHAIPPLGHQIQPSL